ncbi:amino acid adenylation domain-containing protein [Pseudomonas sp. RP23018S]|uniref:non-ribosomal peptide synthetase n=1 Tax=Pseudomonas sp. RP23018S TaxID=3096037 RepID=UPI002AC9FBDD|nr:non-ribosomal peptide synthetase [Pseudomonas sp. RP23018S]MDZ5604326.1 amino acid adenylation domain-containing protein [Pseudomonas sp. RP23018S]
MQSKALSELIARFVKLPAAARKTLYQQMLGKGINVARLPIPVTRDAFAQIPLSFAQERQWFLWELDPTSAAYHLPTALRLHGALDVDALQASFDALLARHDSLRTRFVDIEGVRCQVVEPDARIVIQQQALPLGPGTVEARLQAYIGACIAEPFDLPNPPLLRVRLLRLAADEHVLLLVQHHIVSDAWSMQVMVRELIAGYAGGAALPALPIQYADYALWQRHWMEAGGRDAQLAYWLEQLGDEQPVLQLPASRARPAQRDGHGARLEVDLPAALGQSLKALAQQHGVTLFMLLLASFQVLLQRSSGQNDIRVGVPIANRNRVETEGLIGFFVNTQVLRAQIDGQQPFSTLVEQVKQRALGAQAHQDLPFEQLVDALQLARTLSHNPLFQVVYNHLAADPAQAGQGSVAAQGLRVEAIEWSSQTAQFDLALNTFESADGLRATLIYATDLFDAADAERLAAHWRNLLRSIVRDPQQRVGELALLDAEDYQHTLAQWNPAPRQVEVEQCLHLLIERQAARRPEAIALTCNGEHLSYDQLNRRANRLAHHLIAQGVGAERLVGLACERSFDMLVAVLAVLKAGGAYVPLDPHVPAERLVYILEDSAVALLLGQPEVLARLTLPEGLATCAVDAAGAELPAHNPGVVVSPDNLAYVIYTSGSTGLPKGTLLSQRNVLRLFDATAPWFHFDHQDVWTLFHSYAFDFSVWELFGALLYGGRLVIVPQAVTRSPEDFHALLVAEGVSVLNQTPSAFRQLMHVACAAPASAPLSHLRYVIFGGEALDVGSLAPWFERFGDRAPQLVNMYGITETTVHVTYRPLSRSDLERPGLSPIGEPIADLSQYLLDEQLNPVPRNCVGELYVGRAGLARGYLNRADLTASRFIPNPFDAAGGRLYRTGDLARFGADGVVEYIGRLDQQVKIRGFRIELGEVEARLQALDGIRDAVVLALPGPSGAQLVAYVVADGEPLDVAELKHQLKASLPDYMVPAHVLVLEALPLTSNGKLDRKALPAVDLALVQQHYRAAHTALEQALATIWQEVLQLEQVGLDDDFFQLGGHSLLATQVTSRARRNLGLEVPLRVLFEHSTLGAFAQALVAEAPQTLAPIAPVARDGALALSYAQERQWFLWQLEPDSAAYNIPQALRLRGPLNQPALQQAFDALIERHESLRTRLLETEHGALQLIEAATPVRIEMAQVPADQAPEAYVREYVQAESQRPFDLRTGPLMRVGLLRVAADDHVLLVTQHHIVSDGWSMQVMVDELVALYSAASTGQDAQLPALPIQYVDYASWQRQRMQAGERQRQLAYWCAHLGPDDYVLELPGDHPRPAQQSARGASHSVLLDDALRQRLNRLASAHGATPFMVLLAAFQTLLHLYSGKADIRVGVPIANRNRLEVERLIGFFVNTQVLKADIDAQASFSTLLGQVRQHALDAQANQDLPFEQLVEALQPQRNLAYNPLFQVMFNSQSETPRGAPTAASSALDVQPISWENRSAQCDLSLDTCETEHGLLSVFTYATDLFEPDTIARMAGHWTALLEAIVQAPEQRIAELSLLTGEERECLLHRWSGVGNDLPRAPDVTLLIAEQARLAPDKPAVILDAAQLSYAELDTQANRLAHHLIAQGVGPETLVGIAVQRSIDMVVGVLAILKAGGAYVPLDPAYPAERLRHMMQTSAIGLLLTQAEVLATLELPAQTHTLLLDNPSAWQAQPTHAPVQRAQPEHLAYVIFTSGSTGLPKGVAIDRGALTQHSRVTQGFFAIDRNDRVLQFSTINFDGFVEQMFGTLTCGATLVLRGQTLWDAEAFQAAVREHAITMADLTTAYVSMLAREFAQAGAGACTLAPLRRVHAGGEALAAETLAAWAEAGLQDIELINTYGPTEATVTCSTFDCSPQVRGLQRRVGSVPIGTPLPGRALYILDPHGQPAAVGVIGELMIGGALLARGYHGRAALSAERFLPDPFADGGRLYRTGDLVRYRADGNIEYVGRTDHQVKIRGLRVELGEIESRLLALPAVSDCVVVAHRHGHSHQLVAYVAPANAAADAAVLRGALKTDLRQGLPDYMVPALFEFLPALPLSPNGKVDRKALPAPQHSAQQSAGQAPSSAMQRRIAAIWEGVLKRQDIGLDDNFFELGGDSIISIQVVSRARQAGIQFTPRELFLHQSIRELAAVAQDSDGHRQVEHPPARGVLTLLPIQQAFFEEVSVERHHWNQSVLLRPTQPIDAGRLEQALQALLIQHDALRLRFEQTPGVDWQGHYTEIADVQASWATQPVLQQRAIALHDLPELANQTQRSLDLARGPLLRAVLLTLEDDSQRVLLVVHHLVVDGVSWRILFDDLQQAYEQRHDGQALRLPARTNSLADWSLRLQQWAGEGALVQELDYWRRQLHDAPVELPCDQRGGRLQNRQASHVRIGLQAADTRRLLQQAGSAYRTQINDLLLTALARVVSRWTAQPKVLIQLEGHGRDSLFDNLDLTRTVGWFTSLYPLALVPGDDLGSAIQAVKEQLRAVPHKGLGHGVLRYLGSPAERAVLAALPTPRITFNYLGQFDGSFDGDDGALFSPSGEGSGDEQSLDAPLDNWLSINGQVFDSQLSLTFTFSHEMFETATIERLANAFQAELLAVIEHCCAHGPRGFTPSDFPLAGLAQTHLAQLPLAVGQVEDIYPLSPMQQGMLFHSLEAGEAGLYINQMSVPVEGLEVEPFLAAFAQVIQRHEILRTGFWAAQHLAQPLQIVQRQATLPVVRLDWRGRGDSAQALSELLEADARQPFDLLAAPLMRLTLVERDDLPLQLIWTSHHMLVDGWSTSRLLGEVLEAYHNQPPSPIRGRYRDYIRWLQAQPQGALETFWRERLAELEAPTMLASSLAQASSAVRPGHSALYLDWDTTHTQQLREQAQRLRITPNTLIQATWVLLLQRFTGQRSVCFGATVAGRPASLPHANDMLGLFINTLPVIQQPSPEQPLGQWLQQLQAYNVDVRDYEHASLADIQRWAGSAGQALFDSIIVFENYPVDERLQEAGDSQLRFGQSEGRDVTNFAMDLAVQLGSRLNIEFLYLREHFSEASVQLIIASFECLLSAMLATPDACIGELPMLSRAGQQQLAAGNRLNQATAAQPLLAQQIRAHALLGGERVAVTCAEQSLTWAALERRANQLAQHLIGLGAKPEVRIGVALERSVEVIVAFYAVMKTGAAYVPLDIDYPSERLQWIAEDSGMSLLLTQHSVAGTLQWPATVAVQALDDLAVDHLPDRCPEVRVHGDNLAYLIYTSGSTGKPKGVAVANEPLRMHCQAIAERYAMGPQTRELLFMSFAFDGAQERWLTTLAHGGQLVLRDNRLWTPEETWQALHAHRISIACFPPAYLQQLGEYAQTQEQAPPPVAIYCFGGDAVAEATFELVRQALKPQWLTNGYGPTETVVTPLLWKVAASGRCEAVYAPIGSRVGERTLYVLDEALNPLPIGVAGELYIGAAGLARGYHQRPGLSAERFVADPFAEGGRLYRTGDLVRQRAEGVFDYLGRLDNQVKIRGFRIELGEVEARLRALPGVQDAVVVAHSTHSGKQLIGYVAAAAQPPRATSLRDALRAELPDYMVPAQIQVLARLPLNPNGKVDRLALPAPDFKSREFVAPRTALEAGLARIWEEVLELEQVGVTDSFFELGGDSLRVLKVLSKVRNQPELGLQLKLRDLMSKPTIAELSGYAAPERSLDPLLLLNSAVQGSTPLFCLHAGFGTVFDYDALARRLDGRCSVYGLQCRMLLDDLWQDESLEAMAIDYTQYIRQKQPQGPYHLLGWSLGGPLVSLVAQELIGQGQRVAFAALVDSFVPPEHAEPVTDQDWSDDLRALLCVVLGVPLQDVPAVQVNAGDELDRLEQVIEQARQGLHEGEWSEMRSDELARTLRTGMRLKALSLRLAQMPRCVPHSHCWWAGDATPGTAAAFAGSVQHALIEADHYAILRHPLFIDSVVEHLPQSEVVLP